MDTKELNQLVHDDILSMEEILRKWWKAGIEANDDKLMSNAAKLWEALHGVSWDFAAH